jgi:hypothetical protein
MRTLPDSIAVLHVDDESAFLDMVSTQLERVSAPLDVETMQSPADAHGWDLAVTEGRRRGALRGHRRRDSANPGRDGRDRG